MNYFTGSFIFVFVFYFHCCSLVNGKQRSRVLHGTNALKREAPFMVQLRVQGVPVCGGAWIAARHILTAAHCLLENKDNNITVVSNLFFTFGPRGQEHKVETLIPHEELWVNNASGCDIGVIKVSIREDDKKTRSLVALPNGPVKNLAQGVAYGWGLTGIQASFPRVLQKLNVTIADFNECSSLLPETKKGLLHTSEFCGFTRDNIEHGTCAGDSGGPLIVDGQIVGIVSNAINGCGQGGLEIYTDVYQHLDFINNAMKK